MESLLLLKSTAGFSILDIQLQWHWDIDPRPQTEPEAGIFYPEEVEIDEFCKKRSKAL